MWWIILVTLQQTDEPLALKTWTVPPFSQTTDPVSIPNLVQWPLWTTGRVVTSPLFHLGVRPNFFFSTDGGPNGGAAITIQIRYDEVLWKVIR